MVNQVTSLDKLGGLSELFHRMGTDPRVNISSILSTANDILGGSCSIYNRLDQGKKSIVVWAGVNLPKGLVRRDKPDGHICFEAAIKGQGGPVVIENLDGSIYEKSDTNVKKFGLKSYLGHPVFLSGEPIGALAVVDTKPRQFSPDDIIFITTLAAALSLEEERQDREQRLRLSEARFKALSDASFEAIFFSEDGICIDQNKTAEALFGYTIEESIGRHGTEWIVPGDRDLVRNNMMNHVEAPYEVTCLRKDGITFPGEIRGRMTASDDGRAIRITALRDISSRKKAERALEESEKKFRMIFEMSPDPISLTRLADGTYIDINEGFTKSLGYTRDDVLGKTSLDLGIWEDPFQRSRLVEMLEKKERIENIKCRFRGKHGQMITGLLSVRRVRFKHEDIIVSITRDISELEDAQNALKASEEKYRFITETICDIILMTDHEGNYTYISPSHYKILGRGNDVIGRSIFEHIHPQDQARVVGVFEKGLRTGNAGKVEYRYLHPDRGYIWLESIGQRLDGDSDEVRGVITSRDITERKLAEEAIRKSRERFKSMAELLPCAIVELDKDLNVTYVNQTGYDMFGYTEEDVKEGIHGINLLHPDELPKAMARIEKHYQGIALPVAEYRMVKKDGTEMPVLWNSSPIMSGDEIVGFRGSIMDLSTLKILQNEAIKAQKIESIGTLAGGIAHDFNNILMGLSGNLSLAKSDVERGSTLAELIEAAEDSIERAKDLTRQLLTFAKGGAPVKSLMSLYQSVLDTAVFNLSGSKVKLNVNADDDLWPIYADKGQISQVVSNLVINARHAMPEGGSLRITLANREVSNDQEGLVPQGKYVNILFEDQGVGILPENLTRIYDPYFTTKKTGSGLGMAIVHSIITKHDGYIFARSKTGKGTQFELYFPAMAESPCIENGILGPDPVEKNFSFNILVMDDDSDVREISKKMLQKLGCSVVLADNGESAVAIYKEALSGGRPIDAAIMDLTIPGGMGGKEALEAILAIDPGARAIVASGYSTDPIMANYRDHGFKGFVVKPYPLSELRDVLEKVMGN